MAKRYGNYVPYVITLFNAICLHQLQLNKTKQLLSDTSCDPKGIGTMKNASYIAIVHQMVMQLLIMSHFQYLQISVPL